MQYGKADDKPSRQDGYAAHGSSLVGSYLHDIVILEQTTNTYTDYFDMKMTREKGIKKHFNSKAEPTGPIGHEPSLHCGMPNTQHVDTIPRCRENTVHKFWSCWTMAVMSWYPFSFGWDLRRSVVLPRQ